jgi:hypothetical protein
MDVLARNLSFLVILGLQSPRSERKWKRNDTCVNWSKEINESSGRLGVHYWGLGEILGTFVEPGRGVWGCLRGARGPLGGGLWREGWYKITQNAILAYCCSEIKDIKKPTPAARAAEVTFYQTVAAKSMSPRDQGEVQEMPKPLGGGARAWAVSPVMLVRLVAPPIAGFSSDMSANATNGRSGTSGGSRATPRGDRGGSSENQGFLTQNPGWP